MSGGAAAGHPHPKELLVLRRDDSSAAYPAFRLGGLAGDDREVVAAYDLSLVRVTRSRLVTLVTAGELARALSVHPAAVMDLYDLRLDARGDVYFVASVLRGRHSGCRSPLLERAGREVRQIRASTTTDGICR
jgi:hypothetical protein